MSIPSIHNKPLLTAKTMVKSKEAMMNCQGHGETKVKPSKLISSPGIAASQAAFIATENSLKLDAVDRKLDIIIKSLPNKKS